ARCECPCTAAPVSLTYQQKSSAISDERMTRMKQRLLTPGPSPVPEETLLELAKPVTYHRTAQFRAVLAEVLEDLKYVYCTRNTIVPLTASGTGGMEAAVANCVAPGSKAICLIAGRFGERWRSLCKAFGAEV